MNRRFYLLFIVTAFAALMPNRSPAPLIYAPGEGWSYELPGTVAAWQRDRAKDQLEVAEQAFTNSNFTLALHAAHRVVKVWPLSDYAPRADYLVGRCLEAKGKDEAAFNAYQEIIKKYPRSDDFEEVLWRQYEIAGRFLDGEWFRLWNTIPIYTSMDETAQLYAKIVANGPYSDVAPHAQLKEGLAREKEKNYPDAASAYAIAADRYHNQPLIAADAMYRQGVAYQEQSSSAEYDQGMAAQAISAYTDFITVFPGDPRVPAAQQAIVRLKAEQVRGNFEIAQFYEKSKVLTRAEKRDGALVYYNEVLQLNPNSPYAAQARQRIEFLKSQAQSSPAS